jgi:hypothetical protein
VVAVAVRALLATVPALLVVAVGLHSAFAPPPTVEAVDDVAVRWLWAASLILGGALTVPLVRSNRTRSAGMALVAGGAGFYALQLLGRGSQSWAAAGLLGAFALGTLRHLLQLSDAVAVRRDAAHRRHPSACGGRDDRNHLVRRRLQAGPDPCRGVGDVGAVDLPADREAPGGAPPS